MIIMGAFSKKFHKLSDRYMKEYKDTNNQYFYGRAMAYATAADICELEVSWIHETITPTNGYNYNRPYDKYRCPHCNLRIQNDLFYYYAASDYSYCPRCGIKIKGVQDYG